MNNTAPVAKKPATVQEILQSFVFPEGFEYEAIGFTEDAWVITAPNGAELEIGTDTDDPRDFEGYTWQSYDTDGMEGGNLTGTGGTTAEEGARGQVIKFVAVNR